MFKFRMFFFFLKDGALSEACISGTTSRLCRVYLPPHGPEYFREGKRKEKFSGLFVSKFIAPNYLSLIL